MAMAVFDVKLIVLRDDVECVIEGWPLGVCQGGMRRQVDDERVESV